MGTERRLQQELAPAMHVMLRPNPALTIAQVLDTLAEIDERHKAVKELERSMMEMHQMFLDMAVLVEEQGAQLDNIEN